MRRIWQAVVVAAAWAVLAGVMAGAATVEGYARKVAGLVDPAKLATLGERGANPRVQKYVALLAEAKAAGAKPEKVAAEVVKITGMKGEASKLTARQMVRNLKIAEAFGCVDANGLEEMRRGRAPRVGRGQYKGDELSVDHIIPRQVVPELDNVIANLELLPLRKNEEKNANVGKRQVELGRRLEKAGLLSPTGFQALEAKARGR